MIRNLKNPFHIDVLFVTVTELTLQILYLPTINVQFVKGVGKTTFAVIKKIIANVGHVVVGVEIETISIDHAEHVTGRVFIKNPFR